MSTVSIVGLDKAVVLAALYNRAQPQGLGYIHFTPEDMSPEQARTEFGDCNGYYDYAHGRVMKVDLSGDSFDPWLFDRDNGEGAARAVVSLICHNQ